MKKYGMSKGFTCKIMSTNKRKRIWLIMMLLFCMPYGQLFAQTNTFSFNIKEVPVEKIIQSLRDQSNINFIYNSEQLAACKLITLKVSNATLYEVLDQALQKTPLTYQDKNGTIVIVPRAIPEPVAAPDGNYTQVVRGAVIDVDTKTPLIGATVIVAGSKPLIGAVTDLDGHFRMEKVPVGRIALEVSYVGYEPQIYDNVMVNSAKEVVMKLSLQESITSMAEVVVYAEDKGNQPLNEMALVSARSISPEESNRYAGPFNDPTRIMSNYAGVAASQDGSNDIIVRGNSPKYIQWRLEGVQISNPNHFGDQNGMSTSGISALNNNLLATSDFSTGAFAAEYGDVLSGVYDVKLRSGNNEKHERALGVGIMGTDLTFEGPFKKGYSGSYLFNYRYSTVGLISDLNLVDVSGPVSYQDATYKLMLPTQKAGVFSVFGLLGMSGFSMDDMTGREARTAPGDKSLSAAIAKDYETKSYLFNTGITHSINLGKKAYMESSLVFSRDGIADEVNEHYKNIDGEATISWKDFEGDMIKTAVRSAVNYHLKVNAQHKLQIGSNYSLLHYDFDQNKAAGAEGAAMTTLVDMNETIGTLRNYASWKYRINERMTLVAGLHNMNVLFNKTSTIEPRAALAWKVSNSGTFNIGFGQHSTMESVHNYFAKVTNEDGSQSEPNRNLGLLKARHYVTGYQQLFGRHLSVKIEAYYQQLYDLPVANNDTSYYATINEGLDYQYIDLVNEGTGKNYGVELTIEKSFSNSYYFMINASLFDSKYKSLEGVERNTAYNNHYIANILAGKEFNGLERKKNKTFAINTKVYFGGARSMIPLLRDENGHLAVDPANKRYYDYSRAYDASLDKLYQVDLSMSYKWNKLKVSHELYLHIYDLTDAKGRFKEFYDENEPNNVGYATQVGFFPNMMYRLYF